MDALPDAPDNPGYQYKYSKESSTVSSPVGHSEIVQRTLADLDTVPRRVNVPYVLQDIQTMISQVKDRNLSDSRTLWIDFWRNISAEPAREYCSQRYFDRYDVFQEYLTLIRDTNVGIKEGTFVDLMPWQPQGEPMRPLEILADCFTPELLAKYRALGYVFVKLDGPVGAPSAATDKAVRFRLDVDVEWVDDAPRLAMEDPAAIPFAHSDPAREDSSPPVESTTDVALVPVESAPAASSDQVGETVFSAKGGVREPSLNFEFFPNFPPDDYANPKSGVPFSRCEEIVCFHTLDDGKGQPPPWVDKYLSLIHI